jgi:2,3-diaminopropionate biosynthesis protein SbnA
MSQSTLLSKLEELKPLIGNTPVHSIKVEGLTCFTKLEYNNFSGSIKDRAVYNILFHGIKSGRITEKTVIIESSSGNFAVSIASICNFIGLKFVAVIDPNVNQAYEDLLKLVASRVIKVTNRDETGGYLLNRIASVQKLCSDNPGFIWTNQYENPHNYQAYVDGLGREISQQIGHLDYAFVAVSTCGTITGLSIKLKEIYPSVKIVGVDIEGSLIFQDEPKRRYISGLGSSKRPAIISKAKLDSVVNISHKGIIDGCWRLLNDHSLFTGGSTGASYSAICEYIARGELTFGDHVIFLTCDRGNAYMDTIYNKEWVKGICNIE